jgi:hypothetical protein
MSRRLQTGSKVREELWIFFCLGRARPNSFCHRPEPDLRRRVLAKAASGVKRPPKCPIGGSGEGRIMADSASSADVRQSGRWSLQRQWPYPSEVSRCKVSGKSVRVTDSGHADYSLRGNS